MVALQRAKKPVVDTGVTNWVTTDPVTQIIPGFNVDLGLLPATPARRGSGVYVSPAEAAKEGDQVLAGGRHRGSRTSTIRNVTNACSVAAWVISESLQRTSLPWVAA